MFGRRRSEGRSDKDLAASLGEWVATRRGIEIYLEPQTRATGHTMVLIAHDGEFTRRAVTSPKQAVSFAKAHGFPVYDAFRAGYPQRMRDYTRRQSILRKRREAEH